MLLLCFIAVFLLCTRVEDGDRHRPEATRRMGRRRWFKMVLGFRGLGFIGFIGIYRVFPKIRGTLFWGPEK